MARMRSTPRSSSRLVALALVLAVLAAACSASSGTSGDTGGGTTTSTERSGAGDDAEDRDEREVPELSAEACAAYDALVAIEDVGFGPTSGGVSQDMVVVVERVERLRDELPDELRDPIALVADLMRLFAAVDQQTSSTSTVLSDDNTPAPGETGFEAFGAVLLASLLLSGDPRISDEALEPLVTALNEQCGADPADIEEWFGSFSDESACGELAGFEGGDEPDDDLVEPGEPTPPGYLTIEQVDEAGVLPKPVCGVEVSESGDEGDTVAPVECGVSEIAPRAGESATYAVSGDLLTVVDERLASMAGAEGVVARARGSIQPGCTYEEEDAGSRTETEIVSVGSLEGFAGESARITVVASVALVAGDVELVIELNLLAYAIASGDEIVTLLVTGREPIDEGAADSLALLAAEQAGLG